MTYAKGFTSEGTYSPDNLFAGDFPRVQKVVTIKAGANLTRGAVLGVVTTGGKYTLCATGTGDDAVTDGSKDPVAILAEAAAAKDTDTKAIVYLSGEFNADALTFGANHTAVTVETSLRQRGSPLFLK